MHNSCNFNISQRQHQNSDVQGTQTLVTKLITPHGRRWGPQHRDLHIVLSHAVLRSPLGRRSTAFKQNGRGGGVPSHVPRGGFMHALVTND